MSRYKRDSEIKILKKEKLVSSLLETLIYYPAKEVTTFFQEINLSFPRALRIDVLRRVLRNSVLQTREERATLADEMNYRLSWFNQYTESQLVNLFDFYKDNELNKLYLEEFWLSLIDYITEMKIDEKDLARLIDDSVKRAKSDGLLLPDLVKYNNELNPLFYDEKNKIDGLTLDVIRPVLYKSSTLTEIRNLGKKFGVNVPRRLKKDELIDIIVDELKKRDEHTEEKEQQLNKMSVLLIQRFAKTHNIKASTELKKEEIIEYILSNAKETKASYFVPSSSVYELEAHDVGEAMPEVIIEEVVEELLEEEVLIEQIEEIVEEVVEEVLEEENSDLEEENVVYVEEPDYNDMEDIVSQREQIEYVKVKEHKLDLNRTRINAVQFSGKKPKQFAKKLKADESYKEELVEDSKDENVQPVYITGYSNQNKRKHRNPLWALLRFLLIIVGLLLILLLIYGVIRPLGGFALLKPFDDIINALKISTNGVKEGILDWFTRVVRGLF